MKNFYPRLFMFIIGLIIISFSVALIIKVDLGAGAWDALNVGLSKTIGLTVGTWVFIVGIILIFINAWLSKERPQYMAIVTVFILGFFIDFWVVFVFDIFGIPPQSIHVRGGLLVFGCILLALGIATYLQADFPPSPIDKLMIAIQNRTGLNMMFAKTIGEILALILAIVFKGPIGIGTVIIALFIGPIIQFFFPKLELVMKKLSKV